MEERFTRRYQQERQYERSSHPILAIAAAVLLVLGAVLNWIGGHCVALGRRWAGEHAMRSWGKAIKDFQTAPPAAGATRAQRGQPVKPSWEQHLQRIGPPILIATGGALVVLWTLLGLGGVVVWLASHGYGFFLLLGAVTIGVLTGNSWGALHQREPDQHRRN